MTECIWVQKLVGILNLLKLLQSEKIMKIEFFPV